MKNILFGLVCLDNYTNTNQIRPGCGLLHNAFHLQRLGANPLLLTRIGTENAEIFQQFFETNPISILPDSIVTSGRSASIEIEVQPSGEAVMSNFKMGVWQNFRLTQAEEQLLAQAGHIHSVLVDGVLAEFLRAGQEGLLKNACVSADFLSFRDFTIDSFSQLMQHINVAFIGWKDALSDPTIAAIKQATIGQNTLVIITLGERGIQVFDSRAGGLQSYFFDVESVPVQGNTNGCGDAFISYFLAEYWQTQNLEKAIQHGKQGGAKATQWLHALPPEAYN